MEKKNIGDKIGKGFLNLVAGACFVGSTFFAVQAADKILERNHEKNLKFQEIFYGLSEDDNYRRDFLKRCTPYQNESHKDFKNDGRTIEWNVDMAKMDSERWAKEFYDEGVPYPYEPVVLSLLSLACFGVGNYFRKGDK